MLKNTAVISVLSGMGMVAGLGMHILLAFQVGLSTQADAFFVAFTIPSLINSVIYSSNYALVSSFSRAVAAQKPDAHRFFSIMISLASLVLLGVSIINFWLAPVVVRLLAPGAALETRTMAADLSRILAWTALFSGLSSVGGAMLNAYHYFAVTASADLVRFSMAIVLGLVFPSGGVYSLTVGLVIGTLIQLLCVALACYCQIGFRYRPDFDYRLPEVRETTRLSWAAVQGMLIRQATPLTDRLFASFLPAGSIALIQYGARLTGPTSTVFFSSVISAMLPILARGLAASNAAEVNRILRQSWRVITLISFPVVALLLGLNYPLVGLLFQRGAFDNLAVEKVVPLSFIYNLSLLFYGYVMLQNAYFYAANDKRRVLQLIVLITVTDVLLKAALIAWLGPLASAVSFTISNMLVAVAGLCLVSQVRRVAPVSLIHLDPGLIVVALVMGTTAYGAASGIYAMWSKGGLVEHVLAIAGGVVVGLGVFALYITIWRREDWKWFRFSLK